MKIMLKSVIAEWVIWSRCCEGKKKVKYLQCARAGRAAEKEISSEKRRGVIFRLQPLRFVSPLGVIDAIFHLTIVDNEF